MTIDPHAVLGVRRGSSEETLDAALSRRVIGAFLTPHDVTPTSLSAILALGTAGVLAADPTLGDPLDDLAERLAWVRALAGAYRTLGGTRFAPVDMDGDVPSGQMKLCRPGIDRVPEVAAELARGDLPGPFWGRFDAQVEVSWNWGCRTLDVDAAVVEFAALDAASSALRHLRAGSSSCTAGELERATGVVAAIRSHAKMVLTPDEFADVTAPCSWFQPGVAWGAHRLASPLLSPVRAVQAKRRMRLAAQVAELRDGRVRSLLEQAERR